MQITDLPKDTWVGVRFSASEDGTMDFVGSPVFTSIGMVTSISDFGKSARTLDETMELLGLSDQINFRQIARNLRTRYGMTRFHAFFLVTSSSIEDQKAAEAQIGRLATFKHWLSNNRAYAVTVIFQPDLCEALIEAEKIVWPDNN